MILPPWRPVKISWLRPWCDPTTVQCHHHSSSITTDILNLVKLDEQNNHLAPLNQQRVLRICNRRKIRRYLPAAQHKGPSGWAAEADRSFHSQACQSKFRAGWRWERLTRQQRVALTLPSELQALLLLQQFGMYLDKPQRLITVHSRRVTRVSNESIAWKLLPLKKHVTGGTSLHLAIYQKVKTWCDQIRKKNARGLRLQQMQFQIFVVLAV